jgi:signal transduction histidine kinase
LKIASDFGEIMNALIGNALDIAKLEAGKVLLDFQNTDIRELLKKLLRLS